MIISKKKITIILISLMIALCIIGVLHYNFIYDKSPKRYVKSLESITSENITLKKVEVVYEEELCSEITAYIKNNTDKVITNQNYVITFEYDNKEDIELVFFVPELKANSEEKILVQTFKNIYEADSYKIRSVSKEEADNIINETNNPK